MRSSSSYVGPGKALLFRHACAGRLPRMNMNPQYSRNGMTIMHNRIIAIIIAEVISILFLNLLLARAVCAGFSYKNYLRRDGQIFS